MERPQVLWPACVDAVDAESGVGRGERAATGEVYGERNV